MYEFDSSKTDSEGHSGSEYRYSGPFYQDSYRTGSSGRTAGDVPPKKKKSFLRLLGRAACVGQARHSRLRIMRAGRCSGRI